MAHPFDPYSLFEHRVAKAPASVALRIRDRQWTYEQLHQLALRYSAYCDGHCAPGARVALIARKTIESYAAILGILRSGRSYVPLHPDHPPARWRSMLEKAGVQAGFVAPADLPLVRELTSVAWCHGPGEAAMSDAAAVADDAEAYVMFTSGSTGGPKGVPVGRRQVAQYLQHQLGTYDLRASDRFGQFFALTFDLSVHDLFTCWGSGGMLCVPDEDVPLRAATFVREQRITVWFSVPSLARMIRRMRLLRPGHFPSLRYSFFCGEALPADLAQEWQRAAPNSKVIDLYGPTETTIAITAQEFDPATMTTGLVPIGRVFPEHEVAMEHDDGTTAGEEGALLISGPQVNRGYLNDPSATAKAFIHRQGRTWYRTGDRVRRDPDGVLHFLGRIDDQVKVMGHRVEPAEVDTLLSEVIGGGGSITLPATIEGATRLVTFIDREALIPSLFQHLRQHLPEHMVPARIVHVQEFPHTPHGKLDRQALLRSIGVL